jgi:hypothetical protein
MHGCTWTKTVSVNTTSQIKNSILGGHIKACSLGGNNSRKNQLAIQENSSQCDPPAKFRRGEKHVEVYFDEQQVDDDNFDDAVDEDFDELAPEQVDNYLKKALMKLEPNGVDDKEDLVQIRNDIYWEKVSGPENDHRFHFGASKLFPVQMYWNFYQRIRFSRDIKDLKIKLGWVRDLITNEPVTATLSHSLDIYELVKKLDLSNATGDIILDLFRSWLKQYNVSLPIPKTCRSVRENVEKSLIGHYESELHYELYNIKDIYPDLPDNHVIIQAFDGWFAIGVHIDVMAMLTEIVSYLNISDVHTAFMEEVSESGKPVYSEPCSGNLTKSVFDFVKKQHGPDAFPFFLDLNLDDTPTKSMAKETICPYYARLASVKVLLSSSSAMKKNPIFQLPFLLGFFPISNVSGVVALLGIRSSAKQ